MERMIEIDNKQVRLKSTAGTPKRFKAQFRKDYFAELIKLSTLFEGLDDGDINSLSYDSLDKLDMDIMYDIIWILAKTADNSIPEPLTWLDTFDSFPFVEIFNEIQDLIMSSIQSKK